MQRVVTAVLLGLGLQAPLAAVVVAQQEVGDLSSLLPPILAAHDVPALGVAVLVDGALAGLGVAGRRRADRDVPVTVDDLWHLGSCTKAMTATLLATFVDEQRLGWSSTVAEALPALAARMHKDSRAITVEHLLAHRSGLPAAPPDQLWRRLWSWQGTLPAARSEVARTMLAKAPERPPGSRALYSNAGYMIAGAIAERLGDAPFEELLRARVWQPLGIDGGGFGPPGAVDGTAQPWGHRRGSKGHEPQFADNPPALGPAGTAHLALRDWARFAALHLGAASDGKPLLSPAALAALQAPAPGTDQALGWIVTSRPWAPGPILTHAGTNTMWYCVAWLAPAAKFGVLVTCNHGDGGPACDAVAAVCIQRFRRPR